MQRFRYKISAVIFQIINRALLLGTPFNIFRVVDKLARQKTISQIPRLMEVKETRNDLLFSLILLVLLAWTSGFYIGELSEKQNTETVTDTVTVVTHDTIHSLQPVEVVRYDGNPKR